MVHTHTHVFKHFLCFRFIPAHSEPTSRQVHCVNLQPDEAVPVGVRLFASGLVHRSLCPLVLPPVSRVAGRFPRPPCRPAGGAEAEAPAG
jgi:hypothetical protein